MKNNPKISIITVVYNGGQFLEETMQSVINQTYDNIEYIIIDGGSTDGTLDIIKKHEDRIDYWVSEPDKGIYDAMNKGIDVASGEWINFMNGGDIFFNKDTLKDIFRNYKDFSNIDILYGDLQVDYGSFKRIVRIKKLQDIWKGMVFSHQSSFISAKYHKNNKYTLTYNIAGDFEFFYNAFCGKRVFRYINEIIATNSIEGVSDINRLQTLRQQNRIINSYNYSMQKNLYFIFLYIDQILRKLVKLFLPITIINIIKKKKNDY